MTPSTRHPRPARARGFTLTELMVALTGGLLFSVSVFGLTANVSRFFQHQTRLADATMAVVTGYQRLRADVQRAGFLSSPNFALDPKRCPAVNTANFANLLSRLPAATRTNYPQLERIALARVDVGASGAALTAGGMTVHTDNGLNPDFLYLYGNFTSADNYPTRGFAPPGVTLVLEPTSDELVRSGYVHGAATAQNVLQGLFPVGRLLRAYDPSTGEEQYSVIAGVTAAAAAGPTINLVATVPLVWMGSEPTCGLRGSASGVRVNTVNIVRYGLADLSGDANYAFLQDGVAVNAQRAELVRQEIDPATATANLASAAAVFPGTTELVAELAVDFKVGILAWDGLGDAPFLQGTDATFLNYAGDPTDPAQAAGINRGPHRIRALQPRLAVRERLPSRDTDIDAGASGIGLFRVALTFNGGAPSDYARVRTLQSFISTRNSRNVQW